MAKTLGFHLSRERGVQEVEIVRIFEQRASHNERVYWIAEIRVADRLTGSKTIEVSAARVYRDTPENRAMISRLTELERDLAGLRKQFYANHDRLESFDPTQRRIRDDVVEKYAADMKASNWNGKTEIIFDDASPLKDGTTTGPLKDGERQ